MPVILNVYGGIGASGKLPYICTYIRGRIFCTKPEKHDAQIHFLGVEKMPTEQQRFLKAMITFLEHDANQLERTAARPDVPDDVAAMCCEMSRAELHVIKRIEGILKKKR